MKSMKETKDIAVSPVVGVMLMLVVTIIIAAVVAAFAGGIAGDTETAGTAIIKLDTYTMGTIDQSGTLPLYNYKEGWYDFGLDYGYPKSNYAPYKMTFEHSGGDSFDIKELTLVITYNGATYSTPFTVLTNITSFSVGDKLELSSFIDDGTLFKPGASKYGISQQSMFGKESIKFTWAIKDTSGYVIADGKADTRAP